MTGQAIKGYNESAIAKGETRDCVVRAFASSFEVSYDYAHKYVKEKFGRVNRQGTYGTVNTMMGLVVNKTQVNYKKVKGTLGLIPSFLVKPFISIYGFILYSLNTFVYYSWLDITSYYLISYIICLYYRWSQLIKSSGVQKGGVIKSPESGDFCLRSFFLS